MQFDIQQSFLLGQPHQPRRRVHRGQHVAVQRLLPSPHPPVGEVLDGPGGQEALAPGGREVARGEMGVHDRGIQKGEWACCREGNDFGGVAGAKSGRGKSPNSH